MNALILLALLAILVANVRSTNDIRTRLKQYMRGRSAVLDTADLQRLLEDEVERARRLNYSLSLINIRPDTRPDSPPDQLLRHVDAKHEPAGFYSAKSVNLFSNSHQPIIRLRFTDIAVYDKQQHSLIVLLLGTSKADAERIAQRISKSISAAIRESVRFGCAEFPADNYFLEDLIERAKAASHCVEYPSAAEQLPSIPNQPGQPDVKTA